MAKSKYLEDILNFRKALAYPPFADDFYSILDLTDALLSKVEQSPSESMLNALKPLMKALAVKEIFRHSYRDVGVIVAS